MTLGRLVRCSLRHYARAHMGTLLGAATAGAVLIGALVVGDSVRGTLRGMARERLGAVSWALQSGDRLFREPLGVELARALDIRVAVVLTLPGSASADGGQARANNIQVLGVDPGFWELALDPPSRGEIPTDAVLLNEPLAVQLGVQPGDAVLLRVIRPTHLSRDAPLSPDEDATTTLRLTVSGLVGSGEFGRFSLLASQVPPFNAFVRREVLQDRLDASGQANLLLVETRDDQPLTAERLTDALRRSWRLADAQLELGALGDARTLELRTPRVFLDAAVTEAALRAESAAAGVLTYFVNEIEFGDRVTPYSMVAAVAPALGSAALSENEILINDWLASDLQAKVGDTVTLTYYIVGLGRTLETRSADFRVRGVIPMDAALVDPTLMPDFPGLTDAENCRDWDTGFPIDTERIRPKDEEYWDTYRGAPKAFVALAAGQRLWTNRFGNLTAIRFTSPDGDLAAAGSFEAQIESRLLAALDPGAVGLQFRPVREEAERAVAQSQDFGGLFLGFSLFLMVAALVLLSLLFQFGVEQRAVESGTLLALGFTPRQVRRLLLWEGGLLAAVGAVVGLGLGLVYARAMLHGLATIWRDAVGTSTLAYHAQATTLFGGYLAAVAVAWGTVALATRRQARRPARELLAEGHAETWDTGEGTTPGTARMRWIGVGLGLGAAGLVGAAVVSGQQAAAGTFFGAGALLLLAGVFVCAAWLRSIGSGTPSAPVTRTTLSARNTGRRHRRSLATITLLACGSFLIVSIGVFRLDAVRGADRRGSGTGGFAFFGQSTVPVVRDLNTESAREFYALDADLMRDVRIVPLRVREGDEASCLNLNRAQQPRLVGVSAAALAERQAFTFAKVADGLPRNDPWRLLQETNAAHAVPAIGDLNSILWAMGKNVGDTVSYVDEQGRPFEVRIVAAVANSILQGQLLIDEAAFVRRFPSAAGYRMFLVDALSNETAVAAELTRALRNEGLELVPTVRRLAEFNGVQNTYLGTFQILGGLGLLLGSVGLGVVVLRNVLERRPELALLLAVGFRRRTLVQMIVAEHGVLLGAGLGLGVIAAAVGVLPSVLSPTASVPYLSLCVTLIAVLVNGAIWTWGAARVALRGSLLAALRDE